jgi:hypothetical protein
MREIVFAYQQSTVVIEQLQQIVDIAESQFKLHD